MIEQLSRKMELLGVERILQQIMEKGVPQEGILSQIFVEVPRITFNPVETVDNLLRKKHQ